MSNDIGRVSPALARPISTTGDSAIVDFAKQNFSKGEVVTSIIPGRGAKDLLNPPTRLDEYKVGEFKGAPMRGGFLTNEVFKVPMAGPDDRPVDMVYVREPVLQPNDGIKYRYLSLGAADAAKAKSKVDSPNSTNASVSDFRLKTGFGAMSSYLGLQFVSRDSARELAYDMKQKGNTLTIRVADYRESNRIGLEVIDVRPEAIPLPRLADGTKIVVLNKDGSKLWSGTTHGNPI